LRNAYVMQMYIFNGSELHPGGCVGPYAACYVLAEQCRARYDQNSIWK
jgi:hypothetical protein